MPRSESSFRASISKASFSGEVASVKAETGFGVAHQQGATAGYAGPGVDYEITKANIMRRRGIFKWLHVAYSNDLVYGSWWFVYGSVLCIIIPCFPLIAFYEHLWETAELEEELGKLYITTNAVKMCITHYLTCGCLGIPEVDHVACYSLLIFMGVLYTIGSYAFLRAVETPPVPPLFTWRHFGSDELFGMWCFFWGTVPAIPLMGIYVAYNPESGAFSLALILSIVFTFLAYLAVLACYPKEEEKGFIEEKMSWIYVMCPCLRNKEYISPLLLMCIPPSSCLHKHVATDWLIVSWGLLVGCIFSNIMCIGLLWYSIKHNDGRAIFDYATGEWQTAR